MFSLSCIVMVDIMIACISLQKKIHDVITAFLNQRTLCYPICCYYFDIKYVSFTFLAFHFIKRNQKAMDIVHFSLNVKKSMVSHLIIPKRFLVSYFVKERPPKYKNLLKEINFCFYAVFICAFIFIPKRYL